MINPYRFNPCQFQLLKLYRPTIKIISANYLYYIRQLVKLYRPTIYIVSANSLYYIENYYIGQLFILYRPTIYIILVTLITKNPKKKLLAFS